MIQEQKSILRICLASMLLLICGFGLCQPAKAAADPAIVRAADKEGVLRIYTNTHKNVADDLLYAFHRQYPEIRIDYNDLNAAPLYDRFRSEVANRRSTADFV